MNIRTEFCDFARRLARDEIPYVIVGGVALAYYGHKRPSHDIDIFVGSEYNAAAKLLKVIKQFGFPDSGVRAEHFTSHRLIFQLELPPYRIDLINYIDGVPFAQAWSNHVTHDYDGVPVNLISRADLVQNKRACGRAKDAQDLKLIGEESAFATPQSR